MALAPEKTPYRLTVKEYLAFERAATDRHEYLDGEMYAMAGESDAHGTICMNLSGLLYVQLRGTPCQARGGNTKVRVGPYQPHTQVGLYAYPDLVIFCGAAQYLDQAQDVLLNPTVLIEVLSPTTARYDRGEKWDRYRAWLPELRDYVLVAQGQPLVEHWHRMAPERWLLDTVRGLDAVLALESIQCRVPLVEVYDRVTFEDGRGPCP